MTTARAVARKGFHALAGPCTIALYFAVVVPAARVRGAWKRRRGRGPRILWAPIPVINIRYASRADRTAGYESDCLCYYTYSINARDSFDYVLDGWRSIPVLGKLVPYATFVWAGLRYDVFCLYFDGGLLFATPWWRAELRLMRLAGLKIVVLPYGGDARLASKTRALGRWHAYTDIPEGEEDRPEHAVAERLSAFGTYANVILGCADLVEDLPRLDGVFRYPYDTTGIVPVPPVRRDVVRIVHAPNHRHYKGTDYLIAAVEALRRDGLAVELELVEGVPNAEAKGRYAAADVIADQFLAGAYALFAIEAMALGKPVIGYLSPRFARAHPEWAECPIVSASPDELPGALRRLVEDRELREELGRRGPAYVERWHSLESVGRELDAVYRRLWV